MFGAIAGGIASALAGGAMSKLFGGGQKAASGGIQGDVLATNNNIVGMGDAGIKSAIQGSNFPNFFFSGSGDHRDLHSFPTRRSSDLAVRRRFHVEAACLPDLEDPFAVFRIVHEHRSEEHTSKLQSHSDLVCRLLL